jgi:hypothetical protein
MADIVRTQLGITHLAEFLAAVVGNGMMTNKAAARSVGSRKPAAVVSTAKMRVTVAMPAAVSTAMPTAMPSTVAAPMTAAAALADRRTRQQHRQNEGRNSDCPFGHGTLRTTPRTLRRDEEDADRTEKFRGWTGTCPAATPKGPTPSARSFPD